MKHRAEGFPLSLASRLLACVLCLGFFFGCADNKIIPANKIDSGNVTLSWNNVPGAVSYNIYLAGKAGVTKFNSNRIPQAANPITVTDLALGKTYYFGITAISESGESDILSEKSYTVTDKDGLLGFGDLIPQGRISKGQTTQKQVPEGPVTLTWENVPNAVSYNIYWSESPGVTKQKGTKIANVPNPYTIKGLKRRKTYYFVVTAVSNSGESKESEEFSFSVK
jgi:fibronectin type 3 domain-containing protein